MGSWQHKLPCKLPTEHSALSGASSVLRGPKIASIFREFLQDTSTDFELVSLLLSDRFWMKKGAFKDANALICDFLSKIWELRS